MRVTEREIESVRERRERKNEIDRWREQERERKR